MSAGYLAGSLDRQQPGSNEATLVSAANRDMTVSSSSSGAEHQIQMDRLAEQSQEQSIGNSMGRTVARRANQVAPFKRASTLGSTPQQPATGSLQDLKSAHQQQVQQLASPGSISRASQLQSVISGTGQFWRPISARSGHKAAASQIQPQSCSSSTQSIQQQMTLQHQQQQQQQLTTTGSFRQTSNWPTSGSHQTQTQTQAHLQQAHLVAQSAQLTALKAVAMDGSSCSAAPSKHLCLFSSGGVSARSHPKLRLLILPPFLAAFFQQSRPCPIGNKRCALGGEITFSETSASLFQRRNRDGPFSWAFSASWATLRTRTRSRTMMRAQPLSGGL